MMPASVNGGGSSKSVKTHWSTGDDGSKCADGSRITPCHLGDTSAWVSVEIERGEPVDSVGAYVVDPWGGEDFEFGRFEVWAGGAFGAKDVLCSEPREGEGRLQPGLWGEPALRYCHGARLPFVTLALNASEGWRTLFLNELVVYSPSPPRGLLLPPEPVMRGQVAQEVSARFNAGRVSNDLGEAGVTVHGFDGWGDVDDPWETCVHESCMRQDHWSASVISRRFPQLYAASGFIFSPSVSFLCAAPGDVGTMGRWNGGCGRPDEGARGNRYVKCPRVVEKPHSCLLILE